MYVKINKIKMPNYFNYVKESTVPVRRQTTIYFPLAMLQFFSAVFKFEKIRSENRCCILSTYL